MTEREWLTSDDPVRLMSWVRTSARKASLFDLAVVEALADDWPDDDVCPEYAVFLQTYVDAPARTWAPQWDDLRARFQPVFEGASTTARMVVLLAGGMDEAVAPMILGLDAAIRLKAFEAEPDWKGWFAFLGEKAKAYTDPVDVYWWRVHLDNYRAHLPLLRCIVGNPFRPAELDRRWLTPRVLKRAARVYDDWAFDRLPELADDLEDAGCRDRDVLRHLRGPGPHARGCWALDLLLGKA